jgi:RPA family protein
MSPEEIKKIEARGAQSHIIATLESAVEHYVEALEQYKRLLPSDWKVEEYKTRHMNTMQANLTVINTLTAHLNSGT